jgi:hypothetical protein
MQRSLLMADPQTPQDFLPPVIYGTGGFTYNYAGAPSVAVADVNGDNMPDLVVANPCAASDCSGDGSVAVLLGNGDGTFQPAKVYDSGISAGAETEVVAIGDVNGDGKPDIVVVDEGSSNVGVLLGYGDGTFRPAVTYGLDDCCPTSVAVADVNSDGMPDLIVAGIEGLDVLLGNGNGTFQSTVSYPAGGLGVAVADVNGDGKPDIVVANGGIGVLLGNGDGTFQPAVNYGPPGSSSYALVVADVDGDGKPDVVVANCSSELWDDCVGHVDGSVGVFLGNGDGTFQTEVTYDSGGRGAFSIAVADLNGDGKPDLLVGNWCNPGCDNGPDAVMLLGNGHGTFQKAVEIGYYSDNRSVALVDVNGDGKPDAVIATNDDTGSGDAVAVMLNNFYIAPRATKTVVSTSGSPLFVGQPVKFTAKVTSKLGAIPDYELVTFYDVTTMLGSVPLTSGKATYTTSSLSAKTHYIRATYSGDPTFKPSIGAVQQVVDKYPTTTALSSSLNPSNYGQTVTLTATVTPTGPYPPTGTVTFRDGTLVIGTARLSGGVATVTKPELAVGTHSITATYNGDALNAKSASAAITQTVSQAAVSMVLTSTPNPSTFGKSVHFTATLTSNGGLPSSQYVTFTYYGGTLGTAIVNNKGVATFSMNTLPKGSYPVTATCAGNGNYSSASATVMQVVN